MHYTVLFEYTTRVHPTRLPKSIFLLLTYVTLELYFPVRVLSYVNLSSAKRGGSATHG